MIEIAIWYHTRPTSEGDYEGILTKAGDGCVATLVNAGLLKRVGDYPSVGPMEGHGQRAYEPVQSAMREWLDRVCATPFVAPQAAGQKTWSNDELALGLHALRDRVQVLEAHSHKPFDFTELVRKVGVLERLHRGVLPYNHEQKEHYP